MPSMRALIAVPVVGLLLTSGCGGSTTSPTTPDPAEYVAEIESMRSERVERLRSETGWLSVIDLHWLEQGETPFGSGPSNPIVIPDPDVPAVAGVLVYVG